MTNIHEQDKKKGGRPPTGRVRKLSKSVTVKFSKPSYEALGFEPYFTATASNVGYGYWGHDLGGHMFYPSSG